MVTDESSVRKLPSLRPSASASVIARRQTKTMSMAGITRMNCPKWPAAMKAPCHSGSFSLTFGTHQR